MIDVLIIGAGAAGIAAGRTLAGRNVAFQIVEAADRIGGRAWTRDVDGLPIDMGCGWLHSADRNPWARLAEESDAPIDRTPPAWRRQFADLGFTATEQAAAAEAQAAFDERLRQSPPPSDRAADALDPDCRWNSYVDALSRFLNGAPFDQVSAADYLAYLDADSGQNWRLPHGYGALIAGAAADLPIARRSPVEEIGWNGASIRAAGTFGTIEARAAIIAVPSNVIASERLRFNPPLPGKVEAALNLPLGFADKGFLRLDRPEPFEPDTQLLGDPHSVETGAYYLRPFGRLLIECYFGGPTARDLERDQGALFGLAVDQLVSLLGSDMRKRVTPLVASCWAREPWIGGAYSHALPGRAADRAELARPVADRLFFAGEACSKGDYSTAHGAHDSGVAAAEAVVAALALQAETMIVSG